MVSPRGQDGAKSDSTKKRLFVAIELPTEIQGKLDIAEKHFKRFARDAKWVRVQGIHLTLKFLGYVEPERIPAIEETLSRQCDAAPFSVEAKGCGFFPNSRRPAVFWVGVHAEPLFPLQQAIEEAMATLGFEKEKRPFAAHLTLARFRDPHGLIPLTLEVEKYSEGSYGKFLVSEFVLFESILHPQGAEYRALRRFALTAK